MSRRLFERTVALALAFLAIAAPMTSPAHAWRSSPPDGGIARAVRTGAVLYSQPASPSGGIIPSSKRVPNGSDRDQYAWDAFRLNATQVIGEIRWRGAYDPAWLGSGGAVFNFSIDIYPAIASGIQPDLAAGPLAHFVVGGAAGETTSDVVAGVQTFDYAFVLPTPFQAVGGTKYWLQVEAHQPGAPDWGLAAGSNGDGVYFRRIPGQGENYQLISGDVAFTLLGSGPGGSIIYLPVIFSGNG